MYVKDHIKVTLQPNSIKCTPHCEILTIKLDLINVIDISILGIYRPPSADIDDFTMAMDEIMLNLSTKPNIEENLIGDMNINFKLNRETKTKKYKEFLKNFSQT